MSHDSQSPPCPTDKRVIHDDGIANTGRSVPDSFDEKVV